MKINDWTDDEIRFLKENYTHMTDKSMAATLERHTESSIKDKRRSMGLAKDKTNRKYSFEDVVKEFSKTDYILVSDKSDYKDSAANTIRYICPRHEDKGIMTISLGHLQNGRGCYYCGRKVVENAHIIPDDLLDKECREICAKKGFSYIGFQRGSDGYVNIGYVCQKHLEAGIQFMRKGNMNRDNIIGCPYCFDTKKYVFSKGEKEIEKALKENGVNYLKQYRFPECKDTHVLPFDFYLPNYNMCIEFDGQHHYAPVRFNGVSKEQAIINHENTVRHDKIKTQFCATHKIRLLRIPYNEFNNIPSIIEKALTERKTA